MRRTVVSALVALLAAAGTSIAQSARPDYSGTWKLDVEQSESAANGYDVPLTIVVRQTSSDLIVRTEREGSTETLLYDMDGSQVRLPGDVRTNLQWSGTYLVVKTTRQLSGWAVTVDETWQMDAERKSLAIVKTVNVQHGYERAAPGPATYASARDVFVRAAKP